MRYGLTVFGPGRPEKGQRLKPIHPTREEAQEYADGMNERERYGDARYEVYEEEGEPETIVPTPAGLAAAVIETLTPEQRVTLAAFLDTKRPECN